MVEPVIDTSSSSDDVQLWLKWKGLHSLVSKFAEEKINGEAFKDLTTDDLRNDLGVSTLGERKWILAKIEQMSPQTSRG